MSGSSTPRKSETTQNIWKEMTLSSEQKRAFSANFRLQGQSYRKQEDNQSNDNVGASSPDSTMASDTFPLDFKTDNDGNNLNSLLTDELFGIQVNDKEITNSSQVNKLAYINKTLEKQIDTLRLRLKFDLRHHEDQKQTLLEETGAELKIKTEEIDTLKLQVQQKDSTINEITKTNERKDGKLVELRGQIETLNDEVMSAKAYASDLVIEMTKLNDECEQLEKEEMLGNRKNEVLALRKEVTDLTFNLSSLEKELEKARGFITMGNGRIQVLESDNTSLQLKFKEELAKVSHSMRLEIEKMRDVMKKQWEEMRNLRDHNSSMSRDIKEIRNLLVNGCIDDADVDTGLQLHCERLGQDHGHLTKQTVIPPIPVQQTARGGKTVYTGLNLGALKPSLPVLNKDKKSHQWKK